MKSFTFICPTCGAILNIKEKEINIVCQYCGNTVTILHDDKNGTGNNDEGDERPYSSLIRRKFIVYIPHYNGTGDCINFLYEYGSAILLYEEKKKKLSEEEIELIKDFYYKGKEYITECINNNIDKMVYSQANEMYKILSIINGTKLEFGNFNDLVTMLETRVLREKKEHDRKEKYNKIKRKIYVGLIVAFIITILLLPTIISIIIG